MEINRLRRDQLTPDYGLLGQRLMPWAALNAPFEGGWFTLGPGRAGEAHAHSEYEIFIAVSGEARLESEGVTGRFAAGDVVHFPPGSTHQVVNDTDTDFELYAIWWDDRLARRFVELDGNRS